MGTHWWGGLTPLQKCSQHILQPQLTELRKVFAHSYACISGTMALRLPDVVSCLVKFLLSKRLFQPNLCFSWIRIMTFNFCQESLELIKFVKNAPHVGWTEIIHAESSISWRQHPTRLQLYGHLPPITKTIQVRRTRHAGHCWRSKDELISDVLLWTPTHGCARVGRPARTYIQQLCEDTGCNPEDLPEAMNDREKWRETVRDIRAGGATWWWWWK